MFYAGNADINDVARNLGKNNVDPAPGAAVAVSATAVLCAV